MNGWIKIHRKLMSWEWYRNPRMVHVFLTLLLMANRVESEDKVFGQLTTSIADLCGKTGLPRSTVWHCLDRLEKSKCISQETAGRKNRLITILNYASYQGAEIGKAQAEPPPTDGYFETMKQSQVWRESVEMKFKLSHEAFDKLMDEFSLDCKCNNKVHNTEADARRHFVNWVNKKKEITTKHENNKQVTGDRRRGYDALPHSEEEYKEGF